MYLDGNQPTDWLCNAQRNKEGVIQLNGLLGANFFTKLLHSTETAYSSQNGKCTVILLSNHLPPACYDILKV